MNKILKLETFHGVEAWENELKKNPLFKRIDGPNMVGTLEAFDVNGNIMGTFDLEFLIGTIWE